MAVPPSSRNRVRVAISLSLAASVLGGAPVFAAHDFSAVRPILSDYCLKCHSTEEQKGDLDLEQFGSLADVKRHPKIWQRVLEQLVDGEMPPKKKPQPAAESKTALMDWVRATLDTMALERAGDPGPVVLRRLSNAEYTYTVRDITGVASLDPAHEFPVDGAAGEGFTNTGQALVMSPSLITKYLDAGKEIASHAELLPDGIRFTPATTKRDRTEEFLAQIRAFYASYTEAGAGANVVLQGVPLAMAGGGQLPIEKYLAATLAEREAIGSGAKSIEKAAAEHDVVPKYFGILWEALHSAEPSLLLDPLRARWRTAKPDAAPSLATEIRDWQKALWKFNSIGQIGKKGGPTMWEEAATPIVSRQEFKLKLPAAPDRKETTLHLSATSAGAGAANDYVVWEKPRLVAPGRPDLLLRDVRRVSAGIESRRNRFFSDAAICLAAAAAAGQADKPADPAELAKQYGVDPDSLAAWFDYLGIGSGGTEIASYITATAVKSGAYDFIQGWTGDDALSVLANSSDQQVKVPGTAKPHSVMVHPSPKRKVAIGWRSPVTDTVKVEAKIQRAHLDCGKGITWSVEVRRGSTRRQLASGAAQNGDAATIGPIENVAVRQGDLISVLIGPRDGDHTCGLTAIDLIIHGSEPAAEWNLASDVSPDVLAGNPHADRLSHKDVWNFYSEPDQSAPAGSAIPKGSMLAQWEAAGSAEEKQRLADNLSKMLLAEAPAAKENPDATLRRQLIAFVVRRSIAEAQAHADAGRADSTAGLDAARFGAQANGVSVDAESLCIKAPLDIEVRIPSELAEGCEFVTTASLHPDAGANGCVQVQVVTARPAEKTGLSPSLPIIAAEGSAMRKSLEAAMRDYRELFPAALCYTRIVPVDEVITLSLFYREDGRLERLMLGDAEKAKLDRLWDELHYVSGDAITLVDVFEQLWQYATQDADPKVFEPLREPIKQGAAAFQQRLLDTEPRHLDAVLDFANLAYRRPLAQPEKEALRGLYRKLREEGLPHEQSIRLLLARVLVAPAFLYHPENAPPGDKQAPVNDWELANRLSYFLWSSAPDAELRAVAAAGKLHESGVLAAQTHRMLGDERVRRLAVEFGCSWLHIHDFDELNEKSERHFPAFLELRGAMYEESIRFFTDFFQSNRPILSILDADYTFLNEPLAKYYGIPGVTGPEWRRVDGVKNYFRGGILGLASTLAKQSGASRTSPILRGNWVAEALLGDKLPKPPKDVPQLPEDEAAATLTVRELTEKHANDPRCAGCHVRIDGFGFALENYDAIGRYREKDLGGRAINSRAAVLDGSEVDGMAGLRDYLLTKRRDDFLRQFCRKLLGYSLGRAVQLSDEPLLKEMQAQLAKSGYLIGDAIEEIVQSRQFREIRGRDAANDES